MGYYSYSEDMVFIHSFGEYVDSPSPHGLTGLAYMIPGIRPRPRTWGGGGWYEKRARAFSGPILACYATSGLDQGGWVRALDEPLYPGAGFWLVFGSAGSG